MNLVTTTLPNLGSGRMSRLSALWRRDISLFPSSHVPSRTQSDPLFGSLCSVFRSPLFPVFHALRIEHTAQDVIAHAGQILHAAAADHHHRVLLQIVALAGNVADHFKAVGQPHLGDLAQRRVWLLWRRRVYAGADTALLRALLQRWHFPLRVLRHARLANELVNGRHPSSSLQVQAGAHCAADANPRKTKPRHPLPGAERRLALAEDRAAARSCTDDLTFRSQRQRLSFLGRGVTPRPTSLESNYFQSLWSLAGRSDWRSSPPAEKWAVCIGAASPSQADMGIKARRRKHFRPLRVIARSPRDQAIQCRFPLHAPHHGRLKLAVARRPSEGGVRATTGRRR